MQIGGKPRLMKLNTDLTRYHYNAKPGALCLTLPDVKLSMWGSQDRFVAVQFHAGGQLDVLWTGLDEVKRGRKRRAPEAERPGTRPVELSDG
jgi:hypothetical protein